MANGTIAFDTLSTSGQISGTAKSIDTDFLLNGSAKSWITFTSAATFVERDSFNVSSLADGDAGFGTATMTSAMSNIYHTVHSTSNDNNAHAGSGSHTTTNYQLFSKNSSHALADATSQYGTVHGDLA